MAFHTTNGISTVSPIFLRTTSLSPIMDTWKGRMSPHAGQVTSLASALMPQFLQVRRVIRPAHHGTWFNCSFPKFSHRQQAVNPEASRGMVSFARVAGGASSLRTRVGAWISASELEVSLAQRSRS